MAFWNSTSDNINILHGTYRPAHADAGIIEINLIPIHTTSTTPSPPASIIQQTGPRRKRVSWRGWTDSSGYNALLDDYLTAVESTFSDGTDTFYGLIERLSPPEYVQPGHLQYNITLMETTVAST